jgi:hypothetical protein
MGKAEIQYWVRARTLVVSSPDCIVGENAVGSVCLLPLGKSVTRNHWSDVKTQVGMRIHIASQQQPRYTGVAPIDVVY